MAATTKSLERKLHRLQLEREIALLEGQDQFAHQMAVAVESYAMREASRLRESIGNYGDRGTPIDRLEFLYDDDRFGIVSQWATQPSDHHRGDNFPHWRTETELRDIRGICRFLANVSETAIGIRDTRRNFVVGQGFEITVEPKSKLKNNPEAKEVAAWLTDWLETQFELNQWLGEYEFEAFNTLLEDGEQFWVVEPDPFDERKICFRLEQPDFVTEPGSPSHIADAVGLTTELDWKYGIAAPFERSFDQVAYHVLPYNADSAKVYRPDQVEYVKCNVRRYVKRGVSDFYPVWQTLRHMEKLFANTTQGAAVQAAIAYIREHAVGKTPDSIATFAASRADSTTTVATPNGSRQFRSRKATPGTVVDLQNGAKYHAGPLGQSQSPIYLQVIQQALRIVGLRWQMPEYMVSGDASNANYASTLVAESPFVKSCQSYQYWLAQHYRRLFAKVILCGVRRGLVPFPRTMIENLVSVSVEGQSVEARDNKEAHELRKSQNAAGFLSLQSWAAQEGIDLADEQAKGASPAPVAGTSPQSILRPTVQPVRGEVAPQGVEQKPEEETTGSEVLATTISLNGAQITSAKELLAGVSAGTTTATVAAELLMALGIDQQKAAKMVRSAASNPTRQETGQPTFESWYRYP